MTVLSPSKARAVYASQGCVADWDKKRDLCHGARPWCNCFTAASQEAQVNQWRTDLPQFDSAFHRVSLFQIPSSVDVPRSQVESVRQSKRNECFAKVPEEASLIGRCGSQGRLRRSGTTQAPIPHLFLHSTPQTTISKADTR